MAQILVRDLDDELVARLKEQAKANHRSLQGEVKALLEQAARGKSAAEAMDGMLERWKARWQQEGKIFSSSVELIREDRDSR